MKLFQEKGVWAPQTPAKSIPARQGPVSIPASHEGGKFSFGSPQDSTYFNATTSPDSIDAAQALKGPSGNSKLGAFSTPSENGDAMGRHQDNIGLNKQPQKKARRKKYWPKVLVEAKPKKIPKPSTPKPRTPKPSKHVTSKRFSNEKRKDAGKESLHATTEPSKHVLETTRRALNFNAIDKGKRGLIIHQYQRRKWRQSTHTSVVETGAANDGQAINQTGCCNNISFKVYQRKFRFNQCPSSSRKLGPNFPRMWKKRRLRRRKATILPTCSAIADCGGLVLSNWGRMISPTKSQSWSAVNDPNLFKCVLALTPLAKSKKQRSNKSTRKLNLGATILPTSISATNSSMRCCSAIGDCGGLVTSYWGRRISPSKSQSWSTVNYPNPFKCVLSLTPLATSKKKRSNKSIQRLHLGPATLIPCCNQLTSAPIPQSLNVSVWNQDMLLADIENMVTKRQYRIAFLRNAESDHDKVEGCSKFSTRKSLQDVFSIALTDVVARLEGLHISDVGGQLVVLNENAHGKVGEQRAVILYNPKKRKPLPKVNIDQETTRVWKLLMANGGEDVEEERDEDKEKWWEEQRKIFRGRVDSFISRMHLIQGDRRFSPWKGSVVDSVVGVFLTQNVSDHLSSSAFMSLAAKYPLRSTTDNKACDEDAEIVESQESVASNVRAVVQDDFLHQDFNDSLVDEDPHSTIERSSGCSEILHPKDATCIQEFSTFENGDLSGKESLVDSSISREMENGKQGSSSNSLFDLIGAPASVCSFRSQKQNSDIPLTPCDLEVESRNILAEVSSTMMKDAGEISKNLGCMESCGSVCSDAIVDQMASPRDQEATVELRASLSKCQVLPECSSQAEVNQAKGQHSSKTDQEGSNIILQTKAPLRKKKSKVEEKQEKTIDWDEWRKTHVGGRIETTCDATDSLDWEGVRQAKVDEVADAIKGRGQHRVLAERIKDFLDRVLRDHGSINLEWLRAVPPGKAKEYLLSFKGLGLKSVECVRLLTLHHHAFPVDTNVGRVAVRLGWVPLQPLPESLQIHLLEQYPLMDTIQVYLWPRLCTLDQRTLYELHYQMITFGKVFCRKRKPNCHVCPLRGECRHFASEFASARLALPGPQGKNTDSSIIPSEAFHNSSLVMTPATNSSPEATFPESRTENCEPIIEHPPSPEPESTEYLERDIEDLFNEDEDCIPTIRLDAEEFKGKIQEFIDLNNIPLEEGDMSRALVALTSLAASMPVPKLKDVSRLRTVHHVYEIPDSHCILAGFDKREPCDPSPYLLAIWTSGGTAISSKLPRKLCDSSQGSNPCNEDRCSSCNNSQDENLETVRGTILIPCRTATRGTFPLNGTYFQVNEVFADDETSEHPLNVPRAWIWQLRRRSLHCGAYAGAIFRGLSTEQIQSCFWRGFVCVRGFNRKTREPAHLAERFHVSTITKGKRKFTQDE